MSQFDLLTKVCENSDILSNIVSQFLTFKELVYIDTAINNKELRSKFHNSLKNISFHLPFSNRIELWWKHGESCLLWFIKREMYNTEDFWNINKLTWKKINEDPQYNTFLRNAKCLLFENADNNFNFNTLKVCQRLTSLDFGNLRTELPAEPLELENLRSITVRNSDVHENFFGAFSSCPNLCEFTSYHVRYSEDLNNVTSGPFIDFFKKIVNFELLEPSSFLNVIAPLEFDRLSTFSMDNLHAASLHASKFIYLLTKIPNLENLNLERTLIGLPILVECLSVCNQKLVNLNLNHVRSENLNNLVQDNLKLPQNLQSVRISKFLPSTNNREILLSFFNAFPTTLKKLRLDFIDTLSPDDFKSLAAKVPQLESLIVDLTAESVGKINQEDFSSIGNHYPHFTLAQWNHWRMQLEMPDYEKDERKILFTK